MNLIYALDALTNILIRDKNKEIYHTISLRFKKNSLSFNAIFDNYSCSNGHINAPPCIFVNLIGILAKNKL